MSYATPLETGTSSAQVKNLRGDSVRKLTATQGARSRLYEVTHEPTGKVIPWRRIESPRSALSEAPPQDAVKKLAEREHVGRLLRECQVKSQDLLSADDPVELGLIGSQLINILQELWTYREAREDDWVEILNVLQIALEDQEFESLSQDRRSALVGIFHEGLLTRTVGPKEVERALRLLSEAGFDIWRGVIRPEE